VSPPVRVGDVALRMKAVSDAITYLRSVCEPFGDIIHHCTQLKPKRRATSMVALAAVKAVVIDAPDAACHLPLPVTPTVHIAALVEALHSCGVPDDIAEQVVDAVECRPITTVDDLLTLLKSLNVSTMKAYRVRNALAPPVTMMSAPMGGSAASASSRGTIRSGSSTTNNKLLSVDAVMATLPFADLLTFADAVASQLLVYDDGVMLGDVVDVLASVGAPPTAILKMKSALLLLSSQASSRTESGVVPAITSKESFMVHDGDWVGAGARVV
jgi:hypothetical protein